MANIKSMKKDIRRNEKARVRNLSTKSALKTYVKKAKAAAGLESTAENLTLAIKMLDKAAQRGIIHKNQAARRKARIVRAANKAKAKSA